jgi:hypothetical protein
MHHMILETHSERFFHQANHKGTSILPEQEWMHHEENSRKDGHHAAGPDIPGREMADAKGSWAGLVDCANQELVRNGRY